MYDLDELETFQLFFLLEGIFSQVIDNKVYLSKGGTANNVGYIIPIKLNDTILEDTLERIIFYSIQDQGIVIESEFSLQQALLTQSQKQQFYEGFVENGVNELGEEFVKPSNIDDVMHNLIQKRDNADFQFEGMKTEIEKEQENKINYQQNINYIIETIQNFERDQELLDADQDSYNISQQQQNYIQQDQDPRNIPLSQSKINVILETVQQNYTFDQQQQNRGQGVQNIVFDLNALDGIAETYPDGFEANEILSADKENYILEAAQVNYDTKEFIADNQSSKSSMENHYFQFEENFQEDIKIESPSELIIDKDQEKEILYKAQERYEENFRRQQEQFLLKQFESELQDNGIWEREIPMEQQQNPIKIEFIDEEDQDKENHEPNLSQIIDTIRKYNNPLSQEQSQQKLKILGNLESRRFDSQNNFFINLQNALHEQQQQRSQRDSQQIINENQNDRERQNQFKERQYEFDLGNEDGFREREINYECLRDSHFNLFRETEQENHSLHNSKSRVENQNDDDDDNDGGSAIEDKHEDLKNQDEEIKYCYQFNQNVKEEEDNDAKEQEASQENSINDYDKLQEYYEDDNYSVNEKSNENEQEEDDDEKENLQDDEEVNYEEQEEVCEESKKNDNEEEEENDDQMEEEIYEQEEIKEISNSSNQESAKKESSSSSSN